MGRIAIIVGFVLICGVGAGSVQGAGLQLLNGGYTSSGTDENSTFVFTVTCQGEKAGQELVVAINGAPHGMRELDPDDADVTDGKVYFYATRLKAGVNTYCFKCRDASGAAHAIPAKMVVVVVITPISASMDARRRERMAGFRRMALSSLRVLLVLSAAERRQCS